MLYYLYNDNNHFIFNYRYFTNKFVSGLYTTHSIVKIKNKALQGV